MEKIQVLFPEPQMRRLREAAKREDCSISELIHRATENYLDKFPRYEGGKQKPGIPVFDGGETLIGPEEMRDASYGDQTGRISAGSS